MRLTKLKRVRQLATLHTWPRRVSLLNLLCLFLVVTIFLTAYMHGLIEVDSNRLVINIASGGGGGGGRNNAIEAPRLDLDESESYLSESALSALKKSKNAVAAAAVDGGDQRRRLAPPSVGRYDIKENIYINVEANLVKKERVNVQTSANKKTTDSTDSTRIDKNISNLFLLVDRSRSIILGTLSNDEIADLLHLKTVMVMTANLKADQAERSENDEPAAAPETIPPPPPPPHPSINDLPSNNVPVMQNPRNMLNSVGGGGGGGNTNNLLIANETPQLPKYAYDQMDPSSSYRTITRDLLIKFLKLEKFHLQKMKKKLVTVNDLLEDFIAQNDLDRNEFPEIWSKYFGHISEIQLYNNTKVVDDLLLRISTAPVTNCYEKEKGTQIKLLLNLEDGIDVLVKPMKVPRDYETPPDHFYFVDFERHHAEIAAFHVDRLLGFNRVPPTVGRVFNMTSDLWEKAEDELGKTFFYSPAGNVCFTGHCSYYCDTTHAICGRPRDKMEGSVQIMLPSKPIVKWQVFNHPYRRTYTKRKKALWEIDDSYCATKLLQDVAYSSKLILDLMDMSVFDFLTGNMDRHHYEKMTSLGNDTFLLHLDNGRSFGKAYHDEMSILAPLKQCCLMRYSTFERLKYLYMNKLSSLLDASLRSDPLYPILTDAHLRAVDRRLSIIFYELIECTRRFKTFEVIVDDGY